MAGRFTERVCMATKQGSQNGSKTGSATKTGLGLAALAAAAAGAYYFYGSKNAGKNRKALQGWVVKAKGEVMERMERMKDVSQDKYNAVVDQVMDKYKKVKTVPPEELAQLAKELRGHWNRISSHLKSPTPKRKSR